MQIAGTKFSPVVSCNKHKNSLPCLPLDWKGFTNVMLWANNTVLLSSMIFLSTYIGLSMKQHGLVTLLYQECSIVCSVPSYCWSLNFPQSSIHALRQLFSLIDKPLEYWLHINFTCGRIEEW